MEDSRSLIPSCRNCWPWGRVRPSGTGDGEEARTSPQKRLLRPGTGSQGPATLRTSPQRRLLKPGTSSPSPVTLRTSPQRRLLRTGLAPGILWLQEATSMTVDGAETLATLPCPSLTAIQPEHRSGDQCRSSVELMRMIILVPGLPWSWRVQTW